MKTRKLSKLQVERLRFGVTLGAPTLIWQAVFFLLPLAFLVMMSFWTVKNFRLQPDFTLANWKFILNAGYFHRSYLYTFGMSALAAALMGLIAFPAAYYMSFKCSPFWQRLLVGLLVVPFFTSFPVRIYSMQVFFSPNGVINTLLGLLSLPAITVLSTPIGTMIGFLTLTAPLVIILQYYALNGVDRDLVEAAHNLRCSRMQTIFSVIIPSARVGLVVSVAFAFVMAFGDYISPQFLGGSNPPTLSIMIADQVKSGNHWPRASVVAVSMIITLLVVLGALMKFAYGRKASR
jgi:spermidine/putrescine transport system permease protein